MREAAEGSIEPRIAEPLDRPYRLIIRGEPIEGHLAEASELPDCFTAGEMLAAALANLRGAMAAWFETALVRGIDIPEPELWSAGSRRADYPVPDEERRG